MFSKGFTCFRLAKFLSTAPQQAQLWTWKIDPNSIYGKKWWNKKALPLNNILRHFNSLPKSFWNGPIPDSFSFISVFRAKIREIILVSAGFELLFLELMFCMLTIEPPLSPKNWASKFEREVITKTLQVEIKFVPR